MTLTALFLLLALPVCLLWAEHVRREDRAMQERRELWNRAVRLGAVLAERRRRMEGRG